MKKYKIVIFTSITGHMSLAQAAKSFLQEIPNTKVKIVNLIENKFMWDLYRISYRFVPFLTKLPFEISKNEAILKQIKKYIIKKYKKKVLNFLKIERPDVIITTHFVYIPILDEIKSTSKFRFINIISDPITIHPLILSREADYNIGFDKYCLKAASGNIKKCKILPLGWLVRKKFFEQIDKKKIRKKYKLKDKFTILVCGGSEGNNTIIWLLPFLFFTKFKRDFQIIFICGNNRALEKIINRTYKTAAKFNLNLPKIIVKGFTNKIYEFMAISDIVVGKAGPNLIFESVSMRKPFIAISHISGQEDGNIAMIKKHKFGWVAENPIKASEIITKIIENPKILEKYKHLNKASKNNYNTGKTLVKIVKKMIN